MRSPRDLDHAFGHAPDPTRRRSQRAGRRGCGAARPRTNRPRLSTNTATTASSQPSTSPQMCGETITLGIVHRGDDCGQRLVLEDVERRAGDRRRRAAPRPAPARRPCRRGPRCRNGRSAASPRRRRASKAVGSPRSSGSASSTWSASAERRVQARLALRPRRGLVVGARAAPDRLHGHARGRERARGRAADRARPDDHEVLTRRAVPACAAVRPSRPSGSDRRSIVCRPVANAQHRADRPLRDRFVEHAARVRHGRRRSRRARGRAARRRRRSPTGSIAASTRRPNASSIQARCASPEEQRLGLGDRGGERVGVGRVAEVGERGRRLDPRRRLLGDRRRDTTTTGRVTAASAR